MFEYVLGGIDMHKLAKFGIDKVEVFDLEGSSYVLKNKPGILEKLTMENELEYIDSYINQAKADTYFYHDEMVIEMLRFSAFAATGLASVGVMSLLSFANPESPLLYYSIMGTEVGCGLVGFGSMVGILCGAGLTVENYRKMKKAVTISASLEKYKQELLEKYCCDNVDSFELVSGSEHSFDTDAWHSVQLQQKLGIISPYDWYSDGNLGTWVFRKKYGISKLEVSKHLRELLVDRKHKRAARQKRLLY